MYAGTRVKKRTGNNRAGKYIHIRNVDIFLTIRFWVQLLLLFIFLFDLYIHYTVFKNFENDF